MKKSLLFKLIFLTLYFLNGNTYAQNFKIRGTVKDISSLEPIGNCNIINSYKSVRTDNNGYFQTEINSLNLKNYIVASCKGYYKDSILIDSNLSIYNFFLTSISSLSSEAVVTGTMKESSKKESPIPVEVYSPMFFKKNPTPNIFEALTMVNGVQPQLNCNVCNTGDIHINGMEGPYTMILIDGMPIVSSLSTVYGLSGIPNSMVKRIEVVKGPASTLYGSEAVGGLINIITKDPKSANKLNIDFYSTTWLENNLDISAKFNLKKASSFLGVNTFWFNHIKDINNDGFTDIALQKRISIFNKWDFKRKNNKAATLAFRYVTEQRWGGQTEWKTKFRGTDSIYGESIYTNRFEMIGNYALPFKKQSVKFNYSYNYHNQNSYYGTTKYLANQHTAFAQLLWDKKIFNHNLLLGVPFRYTYYDDNTPATATFDTINMKNKPQNTILPGIFIQDEWIINKKLTTLLGIRYDNNSVHGNIFTPRASFKYKMGKQNIFRLGFGNGYRVVNLFTEDHAALTGARQVVINEELKPEKSWNGNINYTTQISYKKGYIGIDASAFYTYFTNKIVGDFNADPNKIIYDNLQGFAVSKGISLNTEFGFTNGLKIIIGSTLMDVYQIEKDSNNINQKFQQQFAPKVSGTYAISYTLNKLGLNIDITGNIKGPMYLPVLPNDFRPEKSPWFNILNLQLTKNFKNNFELYTGLKNILNFIPKNPIIRPFDPFDKQININNPNNYTFDPSYNYAAVQGIRGFFGFRYKII